MTPRGRPPATRARVLHYIETHRPSTIMQIVRATGANRTHIYRILHAAYGHDFRSLWPMGAKADIASAQMAMAA